MKRRAVTRKVNIAAAMQNGRRRLVVRGADLVRSAIRTRADQEAVIAWYESSVDKTLGLMGIHGKRWITNQEFLDVFRPQDGERATQ